MDRNAKREMSIKTIPFCNRGSRQRTREKIDEASAGRSVFSETKNQLKCFINKIAGEHITLAFASGTVFPVADCNLGNPPAVYSGYDLRLF